MKEIVHARLDEETRKVLRRLQRRHGWSDSDIVRLAIRALADACLVDLADPVATAQILTLDRDFEIYRWRSRRKFELLIDL